MLVASRGLGAAFTADDVFGIIRRIPGVSDAEERVREEVRAEAEKGADTATRPGFIVVGALAVVALAVGVVALLR